MKIKLTKIIAGSVLLTTGVNAASLLENSGYSIATTEVHYDFNNANKNVNEAVTTDASGNGRIMQNGNNPGNKWGGTGEIIVSDGAYYWGLANASGMPTNNYQTSIFVTPEPNWPSAHGNMVLFSYDGIELSYNSDTYYASASGSVFASFQAGAAGVMIQKMNDTFSLWSTSYNADGTVGTWTQQDGEVTNAALGDDFSGMHLFVKPGAGEAFWGYASDFKVQSFAVPETSTTLLGGLSALLFLRRRRK